MVERRDARHASRRSRARRHPVAVKLSPFYSVARRTSPAGSTSAGADGLVLFNRFYQPDIDVEDAGGRAARCTCRTPPSCCCGCAGSAILSGRVSASLAATGGVHTALDAVKASWPAPTPSRSSPRCCGTVPAPARRSCDGPGAWLEEHEYESLEQMQGSMSLARCPNPAAYERANYMTILQSWWG